LLSAGFVSMAAAQPVNLSSPLVASGDVSNKYAVSPDGRYAVFIADKDVNGRDDLYAVFLRNGASVKLSNIAVSGGNVTEFQISPDSSRVVYRADQDTFGALRLHSVSISGGTTLNLSGGFATAGGDVLPGFQITRDGNRVVFIADKDADDDFHLYSSPITSSSPLKLSGTLAAGGDVTDFQISANSAQVVFRADKDVNDVFELYGTPIASAVPIKLSGTLPANINVQSDFRVSANSAFVVFRTRHSDLFNSTFMELYSVPILGGTPTQLTTTNGGFGASSFNITPDSTRVLFMSDEVNQYAPAVMSTPINSRSAVVVSEFFAGVGGYGNYEVSSDSARVVFTIDRAGGGNYELYSASALTATTALKISGTLVSSGSVAEFQISPDASRVVFRADKDTDGRVELYSTPIASDASTKLSGTPTPGGNVATGLQISPDSARVVYIADRDTPGIVELYSSPIAANLPSKISGAMIANGDVKTFAISPDGSRVIFLADKETDSVDELYRVQIGGASLALDIDGDDRVLPLTDLLLLTRYQLGMRGSALIANAVGENATRTGVVAIEAFIAKTLGTPALP
jgi:Tol biopolymer transport system component